MLVALLLFPQFTSTPALISLPLCWKILLIISLCISLAHSLVCLKCKYDSSMASAQRICNSSHVETCSALSTYCDAQVHTDAQNKTFYNKGCAPEHSCLYTTTYCNTLTNTTNFTYCKRSCCQSDSCNDEFPTVSGSDTNINGVDHTQVGQTAFAMALAAVILLA